MAAIAAALIGGAALTAGGGMMGAQAQNRAGRQARDFYDLRTSESLQRQMFPLLGGDLYRDFNIGGLDPNHVARNRSYFEPLGITPESVAEAQQRFTQGIGGPMHQQLQDLAGGAQQQLRQLEPQQRQEFERINAMSRQLFEGAGQAGQNAYQQVAGQIDPLMIGAEEAARSFGRGRERTIREDAERTQKDLDQRTAASLAGLGANTFQANAQRANAADVGLSRDRALSEVADQATQLFMGARGARAGTMGNILGAGAQAQAQAAGAGATVQSGQLQQQAQALGNIRAGTIGQEFQLQSLPLQTLMNLFGSPANNPFLGQSTGAYYPGASPGGAAMSQVGGGLSLLGGYGLANGGFGQGGGGGGGGIEQKLLESYVTPRQRTAMA